MINELAYNINTKQVRLNLDSATAYTPDALIRLEQPAKIKGTGSYGIKKSKPTERGFFRIALKRDQATQVLIDIQ